MRFFSTYKNKSDEELMERFQGGDHTAFETLYRRYSKRLLHFVYRMLNHDEPRAQDVLQEVFTRIVEQPMRFDTSRSFKPWIFTVTANACRKEFRGPGFEDSDPNEHELRLNEPPIETRLDQQAFKRAL